MQADPEIRSLWQATATPAPDCPPLTGERRVDVAVVGGGFTGLSAALHLAEAGAEVAVLEAQEPGWGASGRNGGMVIPGLKEDPDELVARHGPEAGEAMVRAAAATADLVFGLIERHGIACDARRAGWIQPAHTAAHLPALRRRHEQWARRGADVAWLDREAIAARLGSDRYHGGWIDRRGGGLQPLSYARGLARAARAAGAAVHGQSPVTALQQQAGGWRLDTPGGRLTAEQVVIGTNGYTPRLWPGLAQSVVPVFSVQVATAPLSENVRRTVLADGEVLSDTRRILWYYRQDAHGRLLMGGGGAAWPGGLPRLYEVLRGRVRQLLPQVSDLQFEFEWNGRVALTMDHLPHLHELAPGLWAGLGYNGRGVGMATMMGRQLAQRVLGTADPDDAFPASPLRPLPLHGLRGLAVTATRSWYRLRDALDG